MAKSLWIRKKIAFQAIDPGAVTGISLFACWQPIIDQSQARMAGCAIRRIRGAGSYAISVAIAGMT